MTRIVIDTNVLVSAAVKNRDPEAAILWIVGRLGWEWIASESIVAEYRDVLARKKFRAVPPAALKKWNDLAARCATLLPDPPLPDFPRDRGDAKFLACAVASGADYLLTGDRDFSDARRLGKTVVISVRQFRRQIMED